MSSLLLRLIVVVQLDGLTNASFVFNMGIPELKIGDVNEAELVTS